MAESNDMPRADSPQPPQGSEAMPDNEIAAGRERRRKAQQAAPIDPLPGVTAKSGKTAERGTRHPVPAHVRERFVNVGKVFYFPDGAKAFEDHGKRLSTPSENTEVTASLVAIAKERDWKHVIVSGSERFRREAWRQALRADLAVSGYTPTPVEKAKLARDIAQSRSAAPGVPRSPRASATASQTEIIASSNSAPSKPTVTPAADQPNPIELDGELLAFGKARYHRDPNGSTSYFVEIQTASGARTVWGKDLERAIQDSTSTLKVGDTVSLKLEGRDSVTIRASQKLPDGSTTDREEKRYRNRWSIESKGDRSVVPGQTLSTFPSEPAGSSDPDARRINVALAVRQAELLAEKHIQNDEHRAAFVDAIRQQLGERLESGQAVPAPGLRDRLDEARDRNQPELALR